ncbi:MAG: hypothetical protein K0V04_43235 [Deltaproteobacteria bacterium]|nr:hypothetical protein [Deltaproteobacteria bacterium]
MLIIRSQQISALESAAAERFVGAMVDDLRLHLPHHCRLLDEHDIVQAIRYGIARAKQYRLVSAAGAGAFVRLMFILGPGFDTAAALPWAQRALGDSTDEATRVRALYLGAMQHQQALAAVAQAS